ncbi:aldo/keto reductase [Fictibacillus aquaticus]|uniref:Aldo/keto reductase n=1 Tax=Fictibacillus aquaticus TaxID=2021314 RepID=A0A235FFW1_9BACL|nr:aldo/keto reductase [Fictibacillus aquaticus]OYD59844.1 aldo/keto reductase [Fictibacillus aquaticus]
MVKSIHDRAVLHNGVKMPWLGLGVYKAEEGQEVEQAIQYALDAGYRSIDTAKLYENERSVGVAIRDSGIPREEIFVTTKVWNTDQGYESTLAAFQESLNKLELDYVDLYLIHWPVAGKYKDTWRALEEIYRQGKAKAIGVSNFNVSHLEDLMTVATIKPMVNQVELHPRLTQKELLSYCKDNAIQLEAWRPLVKGEILQEPVLQKIADKHDKTTAQVVLRWNVQSGIVTIPKSVNESRIRENADIFDFELSAEDMLAIDGLNENKRNGADPDNFDF